jgi:hypothetical protein
VNYDFTAIPDADVPQGCRADLPAHPDHLCRRGEPDGRRVGGRAGRLARLEAAREGEPDPHHHGNRCCTPSTAFTANRGSWPRSGGHELGPAG